jgi:hypothetical protein
MDYRERLLLYLREHRDDIEYRIGLFSSGRARIVERGAGGDVDITDEVLVRLYRQLGEVGALIQETAKAPDDATGCGASDSG